MPRGKTGTPEEPPSCKPVEWRFFPGYYESDIHFHLEQPYPNRHPIGPRGFYWRMAPMIPGKTPSMSSSVELTPQDPFLSSSNEDIALLFYALLDDEDLEEVFGDSFVPVQPD